MLTIKEAIDREYYPLTKTNCINCQCAITFYSSNAPKCEHCGITLPDFRKLKKDRTYREEWHRGTHNVQNSSRHES
jgi:hypothetical protein